MKNKTGILIGAVIMLLLVGIISAMAVQAAQNDGFTIRFSLGGKSELRNTIEIPLAQTAELEVAYTSKNLEVHPTDGDTIIIKEYLISGSEESHAQVAYKSIEGHGDGKQKVIVTGGKTNTITIFGIFGGGERIEIYVPQEGLEALTLQTKSGNITAEDGFSLKIENLTVTASSGNIKWHDTEAAGMEMQASSGNIRLERLKGDITAQTGSGNIRAGEISGTLTARAGSGNIIIEQLSGRGMMEAGSGNITVEQLSGQGSMKAGSGNVRVEAQEVTGDIDLTTSSGNIRLTLPEGLSFRFEAQTSSGDIDTFFDEAISYNEKGNQASGAVGENPGCLIRAEAKSGNVDIMAE